MSPKKGITLGELAKKLNAELVGNPEIRVKGLNTLTGASQDEISFLSRRQYIKQLDSTKAVAVIIGEKTFGKGSVQAILPIDKDEAVRLTIARYYLPSGRTIQIKA